jgi:DNA repair protein RecO (recombination protein O)
MIRTEGIILKKAGLNEVDQLLIVYTKELGKVRVSAKGTRKLESKLRYSIEPISYVQLILVEGKNFLILKDAIIKDQFLKIKKDLNLLKTAKQIADLIGEAIIGEEKDENIWHLILTTYKALDVGHSISNIKQDFEKNLIKLLGYDTDKVKKVEDIY